MKTMKPLALAGTLIATAVALAGPARAQQAAPAEFKAFDLNHDGKVSPDEHAAAAKRMFAGMDGNRDGRVSADEMTAAQARITGKKAQAGDMSSADKIKVVDTDGDGVLTAAEHAGGSKTMFDRMDADRDGFLSASEWARGHAALTSKSP